MKKHLKYYGFTLAEVLITLGIIGIVAAMTIPTLVAKYQEKAWDTSATVFERKLEEALKVMNTRETLAGYNNTKDFVNELANHFKIIKVCDDVSDCFEDSVKWKVFDMTTGDYDEKILTTNLQTAKNLGQSNWGTEAIGVQFANGVSAVVAYNDYNCKQDPFRNDITGTNCLAMIYDTSGYKSPNTVTKDVRGINSVINKCAFKSKDTCFSSPVQVSLSYAECMREVKKGELGIKECYYDTDYWAGAVKTCGGLDYLPTKTEVDQIASYVYNTTVDTAVETITYANLSKDRLADLGFGYGLFDIWYNNERSAISAGLRYFALDYTQSGYYYRNQGGMTVCISSW